jgi:Flp pilus assembly protein CpaB
MRVAVVDAAAGAAKPDSRVDVLVAVRATDSRRVVKLFMQNMRLLELRPVPQLTSDGRQLNALIATVEVTREEAERLAMAQSAGELQLVVRGAADSADKRRP